MSENQEVTRFAECPGCGELHAVKEDWIQATRKEPPVLLGLSIICPNAGYLPMTYPVHEADIQFRMEGI